MKPDFQDSDSYKLLEWGLTVIPVHQLLQGDDLVVNAIKTRSRVNGGTKNDGIGILDGSCGLCMIIFTDGKLQRTLLL